jgi:formylglycine-generating enzyme required for sulfatase activity
MHGARKRLLLIACGVLVLAALLVLSAFLVWQRRTAHPDPRPSEGVPVGEAGDYEAEFRPVMIPPPSGGPTAEGCKRSSGPPRACSVKPVSDDNPPDEPADCVAYVPGGEFWMGSQAADPRGKNYDESARADEGPPHPVRLSSYWIQRYEVSVAEYVVCIDAGGCDPSSVQKDGLSCTLGGQGELPITGVSWQGAADFCRWLGGGLPTEAQWEFAARGSDGRRYPWGNRSPHCKNARMKKPDDFDYSLEEFGHCAFGSPEPAIHYRHDGWSAYHHGGWSAFGVTHMAGNVWEWVADRYGPYPDSGAILEDPAGPEVGDRRVQRGGGFDDGPEDLRSSRRGHLPPGARLCDVGFRCVFTIH